MRTASEIMAAAQPAPVGELVGWRWKYEGEGSWTFCKNKPKWAHHVDVISEPLYLASPTPAITDEMVEAGARCMAFERGYDPDEPAAHHLICGPNNETLPIWRWYEESMRAALTAALRSSTKDPSQ